MIKKNISRAKKLRKTSTEAEKKIWSMLRRHRFSGKKFKRQQPIGHYIVDFVCFERQLIIEIDGGQHSDNVEKDQQRDDWLITQGYKVLRFWNNDVIKNIETVLEVIRLNL